MCTKVNYQYYIQRIIDTHNLTDMAFPFTFTEANYYYPRAVNELRIAQQKHKISQRVSSKELISSLEQATDKLDKVCLGHVRAINSTKVTT